MTHYIDIVYIALAAASILADFLFIFSVIKTTKHKLLLSLSFIIKVISIFFGFILGLSIFFDRQLISQTDYFLGMCCMVLGLIPNSVISMRYYLIIPYALASVIYIIVSLFTLKDLMQSAIVIPIFFMPIVSLCLHIMGNPKLFRSSRKSEGD